MAKNINVNRNVYDPYYRYKMPRIMAKVEGKGNGIKTVIANMSEIGKALARPPTYPTKYFGCELGAQTNFDLKNERYIVNGEHDANKLQDILDGFIKKFVLCPACDNPETALTVKRSSIHSKCKACGHSFLIDPKHKLSTFIVKNPPPPEGIDDGKERRGDSGSPTAGVESGGVGDENGNGVLAPENVVVLNGVTTATAPVLADDDDWAPAPVEETAGKLSSQIGKLVLDKDLEKTTEERLDMLHNLFLRAKAEGTITDSKAMLNEAERLELKTKAPLLLADVIFDCDVVNQIGKHRTLLLRFCLEDKKAQRHLLGGIEQLIHNNKDVLLPKAAHIIKALYDRDVCEEETLLAWGDKPSSKYVKKDFAREIIKVAQPVLDWLRNAEEDSESEDDDDEVAVNFDDRSCVIGTVDTAPPAKTNGVGRKAAAATSKPTVIEDENGDEFDIDNI